jgi:hypothetical protein
MIQIIFAPFFELSIIRANEIAADKSSFVVSPIHCSELNSEDFFFKFFDSKIVVNCKKLRTKNVT